MGGSGFRKIFYSKTEFCEQLSLPRLLEEMRTRPDDEQDPILSSDEEEELGGGEGEGEKIEGREGGFSSPHSLPREDDEDDDVQFRGTRKRWRGAQRDRAQIAHGWDDGYNWARVFRLYLEERGEPVPVASVSCALRPLSFFIGVSHSLLPNTTPHMHVEYYYTRLTTLDYTHR